LTKNKKQYQFFCGCHSSTAFCFVIKIIDLNFLRLWICWSESFQNPQPRLEVLETEMIWLVILEWFPLQKLHFFHWRRLIRNKLLEKGQTIRKISWFRERDLQKKSLFCYENEQLCHFAIFWVNFYSCIEIRTSAFPFFFGYFPNCQDLVSKWLFAFSLKMKASNTHKSVSQGFFCLFFPHKVNIVENNGFGWGSKKNGTDCLRLIKLAPKSY